MPELITFGETLAVFTPKSSGPLRYVPDYGLHIAGAESNTAIGLQKLGHSTGWFSRLGGDEFGQFILNSVRSEGVDVSHVRIDKEHRTALMVKETSNQNETRVYYYREHSACSFSEPEDLEEAYLKEAKILHLTGITPVLSKNCEQTVRAAIALAKKNQIMLSFDPNIRYKLWGSNDHSPMIREMMLQSNIILAGLEEAAILLGTKNPDEIFEHLFKSGCVQYAALKDGGNGAWVATPSEKHHIPPYPCHCIDPIGAGDAFNAAFLAGILENRSIQECGSMGGIAGALATQTVGDIESQPFREDMDKMINHSQTIFR